MKNYFKKIVVLFSLVAILALPNLVFAVSSAHDSLDKVGSGLEKAPYEKADQYKLSLIVSQIVQAFLGLLGIIFLVLIIYAGFNWMTAQGDEEKVTKAKDTLTRAVIGLVIIILAYTITYFVFSNLPGSGGTGAGVVGGSP